MSDCKVFRAEIDEAADGGALGPRAAAHANSCAACGAALRVRGLVRGLGRVEAPADFEYRLRARMARSKPGGGHGVFGRLFPLSGLAWAAVAVCVLSLTAAVYYRQAQTPKQGASNGVESARAPEAHASPTTTQSNNADVKPTQRLEEKGGSQTIAAASNVQGATTGSKNVRHAALQPRERELSTRAQRVEQVQSGTVDAAVRAASVQLPKLNAVNNGATRVAAQGIQLGTSAGTLRVVLRDERGTLVPMRSVSFGSQEPLSRQAAVVRVSTKDEEGVW